MPTQTSGGAIAQLVERLNGIQEVRGSTPLGSTSKIRQLRGKKLARNDADFRRGNIWGNEIQVSSCPIFRAPLAFIPARLRTADLFLTMRLERGLTDRARPGVQSSLALAVAIMSAELPEAPERLAAMLAYAAGLLHVGLGAALTGLAAIDHVAARFCRDRAAAPGAFAILPCLDPFRLPLIPVGGQPASPAAIHSIRR